MKGDLLCLLPINFPDKYIFISGFLFTSVLGTLSHFFYEWSGDSTFIGLVCPISESAWEHMKLLFFPALLYCFLFKLIYKNAVPNVSLPLLSGILTGTTLIPVFFYTYSGILGFTVVWIDIAIFYLCTGITFSMASKLYEQKNIARFRFLIYGLTILYSILFFIFTLFSRILPCFKTMTFHTASCLLPASFFYLSFTSFFSLFSGSFSNPLSILGKRKRLPVKNSAF